MADKTHIGRTLGTVRKNRAFYVRYLTKNRLARLASDLVPTADSVELTADSVTVTADAVPN